jgi:hypothetical protein
MTVPSLLRPSEIAEGNEPGLVARELERQQRSKARHMYTFRDYEEDTANNEDRRIPTNNVRWELERHDANWTDFVSEVGEHADYSAREVLGWLGY